jgi:ABC-2 type transport system permease protein
MAYLRRDFLIWTSYRLAALWQVVGIVTIGALVYFAGTAIGDRSEIVQEQDGSYVAFILVGLAFMDVLLQGLGPLPQAIHDHQRAGTLEPMMLAPISDFSLLTSFWLFKFFLSLIRMTALMSFGFIVLGFWHSANPVSVLLVLIPAELTFLAIGAFSAAFVILVKEGDPVRFAYTGITTILGGAFFPVSALPDWIEPLAYLVPLTYALDGIRSGLDGGSPADVMPHIVILTAMAAVMLPAGLYAFRWSIRRAKQEGSLGEY